MRMAEIEIHDYARQLLDAHGEMAVVEAAQKARSCEEKGQTEEAETWRHIEAVLKEMRGPVCTENSNSNIMVMQSAKDRVGMDASSSLSWARERRVLI